jgi:hypothetical protein
MSNPLMKKNPLISLWLSHANRAFAVGSNLWRAEIRRQQRAAMAETNRLLAAFWTDALKKPRTRSRKKAKP